MEKIYENRRNSGEQNDSKKHDDRLRLQESDETKTDSYQFSFLSTTNGY